MFRVEPAGTTGYMLQAELHAEITESAISASIAPYFSQILCADQSDHLGKVILQNGHITDLLDAFGLFLVCKDGGEAF